MTNVGITLCAFGLFVVPLVLSYGIAFAYFQRSSSPELAAKTYRQDLGSAVMSAMFASALSWFGVLLTLCLSGFAQHGLKFR